MAFENDETRAERDLQELMGDHPEDTTPEPEGQEPAEPKGEEPKPAQIDPPKPDEEGYKHRYLTLQGMMRAEKERHRQEKEDLLAQIQELKSRPQIEETVDVEEDYRSPQVTDEIRNSMAYRRMAELNGTRHTEIHFESLAMMQPQSQPQPEEKQASPDFLTDLDRLTQSKWRQLNDDSVFLGFLAQVAPYSGGMTLQDKLDEAVRNRDAAAAAQFFIDFIETQQKPKNTASVPDELVAPPRRGSTAQTAAENHKGRVYTQAEWNQGWKSLELGNMSAKAAAELEQDLTNAPAEGRIVG